MRSKWFQLKPIAIKFRKKGYSIRKIECHLGISRSTLSGWFKYIELSSKQKEKLLKNWKGALVKAREKAVLWHNAQKAKRLQIAKETASKTLENINLKDLNILELALAILYMGEGSRKTTETAIGNSNPLILKFFLAILKNVYNFDVKKIRCELNIRADQNPRKLVHFWSKELNLPLSNFKQITVDKRTIGTKTYPYYNGVCQLRCSHVHIQRKLLYLSELFCEKVIDKYLGS